MPKYVIANSPEEFQAAKNERADLEEAIYLGDPSVLAGLDQAEIVVLEGAESHPLIQNARVQRFLRDAGSPLAMKSESEKLASDGEPSGGSEGGNVTSPDPGKLPTHPEDENKGDGSSEG